MVEYVKINQKLYAEDGGELLRYSISYPKLSDGEKESVKKINAFLEKITLGSESFCKKRLLDYCKKLRETENNIYKPYSYKLSCAVSFEDGDSLSVLISARLGRLGERAADSNEIARVFSKADGLMLTPYEIIRKYAPDIKSPKKHIRKNRLSSVCLGERGVMAIKDGKWILLS